MSWKVTIEPVSEPLTVSEVKTWLRVEDGITADDTLISSLITAARKHVERYTGISLLSQTIQEVYDDFPLANDKETPNAELRLSVSPLISVTSVGYVDSTGSDQTVSALNYVVDDTTKPGRIAPTFNYTWPETYNVINAVTVTYSVGHTTTTSVGFPSELLIAMKLWISGLYETRQDYAKRYKDASMALMDTLKIRRF